MTVAIDAAWLDAHPLPDISGGKDKSERGTILVVAGSALSPGAGILTAEAALRVGAGRVQLGTLEMLVSSIAAAFPECALVGLPTDGEGSITAAAGALLEHYVRRCDVLTIGPGMTYGPQLSALMHHLLGALPDEASLVMDAGAIDTLRHAGSEAERLGSRCIVTPHHGELARLLGIDATEIADDPEKAARAASDRFGVVVVLKDMKTVIAAQGEAKLHYVSPAAGLGTAGSGDVLAGAIAGFLARGCPPLQAAGWGVAVHGAAGRAAADDIGQVGFLARDLLPRLPRFL